MFQVCIFRKTVRCFKEGSIILFHPGVNLIVGDQGCGKSTLLDAIDGYAASKGKGEGPKRYVHHDFEGAVDLHWDGPPGKYGHFDFEKGNPRTQPAFGMDDRYDMDFQVSAMFSSHGQTSRALLNMFKKPLGPHVISMDEPDMALSPRSLYDLIHDLQTNVEKDSQVLLAVHNPEIIRAFPEVLSLEHGQWMSSEEFLDLQRTTPAPVYGHDVPRLVKIIG